MCGPMIPTLVLLLFASSEIGSAQPNENTTLVLHAVEGSSGQCVIPDPCDPGPATTFARPGPVTAYLIARNYSDLAGLQTAFDWDDWTFVSGVWNCRPNQINTAVPVGPGPIDGTLATTFDPITGGQSAVIGYLWMNATSGALMQIESGLTDGTHVLSSTFDAHPVQREWRGLIEVEGSGIEVCSPSCNPVEPGCSGDLFSLADLYQLGSTAGPPAFGDLNGDSFSDLIATTRGSIAVLLGLGDRTFGTRSFYGHGLAGRSMVLDLNGDPIPDLAVAAGNSIAVLLGTGDGSFPGQTNYSAGGSVWEAAAGDLNADRIPDMVAVLHSADQIAILLGGGDGSLGSPALWGVGDGPTSVAIGDLNGDQVPDLAVGNFGTIDTPGNIEILLGVGDGTFLPGTILGSLWASSIALADVNGDARLDLAVLDDVYGLTDYGRVVVYLGAGDGTFILHYDEDTDYCPKSIAVGDIDLDHNPDLIITSGGNCTSHPICVQGEVEVRLGNGDGSFSAAGNCVVSANGAYAVATVDLDGDLVPELAASLNDGGIALLRGLSQVGIGGTPPQPAALSLRNTPNPFSRSTEIQFESASEEPVSLTIYDGSGRLVRSLIDQRALAAGEHRITWDGRDQNGRRVPSGVYLCRLRTGPYEVERTLHIVR